GPAPIPELRRPRYPRPPAPADACAAAAAAATPTHSGRYALPFFHIPHSTAARLRAVFRSASRGLLPASRQRRYWSAKGFPPAPPPTPPPPRRPRLMPPRPVAPGPPPQPHPQVLPQRRLAPEAPGRIDVAEDRRRPSPGHAGQLHEPPEGLLAARQPHQLPP